jgi:biuret amidohydrolase
MMMSPSDGSMSAQDLSGAALITNECQRGAIGEEALWPSLREAAAPIITPLAWLLESWHTSRRPVVHLLAVRRSDMKAANRNAPMFETSVRKRSLVQGTPSAELLPELGPKPSDLVIHKTHGVASIRSTGLDNTLRNLGIDTVVVTGVSLNVAIPALAFEAVNLGYRVVVPSDAVAGVPETYGHDVLQHTLRLVAQITTTDDLIASLGN